MTERLAAQTVVDGRYEVLQRLGSGGMADVYCAHDLQLGRKVALKVLYRRFAQDDEFVERFRREASSAAGLQHPNVVAVYDRGQWDDTYYIAMEYLEGRSLKQVVQEDGPLDPVRAIDLSLQILKAARFAHRHGIIHRDLKPHNVIVDDEDRAKVTDFGIARAVKSEMTQTGSIMGTVQYLSPEQAQGHAVSARSDLYAIGVILYELLTGRVPFEAESAVTIALKHVSEPPIPPRVFNAAVTSELEAVVIRALEKDPERRFADADDFIAHLQAARAGIPVGAVALPPPPPAVTEEVPALGEGVPRVFRRPESPWRPQPYMPPSPPPAAPAARRRRRSVWWLALLALLLAGGAAAGALVLTGPTVTVPRVVGVPLADAELRLHREGFDVEAIHTTSLSKPSGIVIGQDPGAFARAKKGSTVTLTVSDGPGQATVPRVQDLGRRAAHKKLRAAGFEVDEVEQASDDVGKDHVIGTSPADGEVIDKGSTVTMYVSTGPEKAPVPDVVGQQFDDATATLEDAGFKWRVRREDSDKEPGTVLSQQPGPGATAPKGSRVTLVVARESAAVPVPNVTGKSEDDAIADLARAGFVPKRVSQPVLTPDQDGIVLSQDPKAGKKAPRGSTVTITIGRYTAPPAPTPAPPPPGGAGGALPPPTESGPQ